MLLGAGQDPTKTMNLLTAAIKPDDDSDGDLRFCFRVVSPGKVWSIQAENELERMEWMTLIQVRGVTDAVDAVCILCAAHLAHI